jgi:hypothetical protein
MRLVPNPTCNPPNSIQSAAIANAGFMAHPFRAESRYAERLEYSEHPVNTDHSVAAGSVLLWLSAISCQLEDTLGGAERIQGLVRLRADG